MRSELVDRVTLADARSELDTLVDRASRGEEIVITLDGRPVAKLSAATDESRPSGDDMIARFRALRQQMRVDGVSLSWEQLKEIRDEGRR